MKIAIVGCGAVGSFYGAKLCRAGQEVHFLLRSDFEAVSRNGVFVLSPEGDFSVRPRCASHPQEIGACDLVLIALKTTANGELARLLPPLVGANTVVLTLQNGLGNEAAIAKLLNSQQTMGGLCFVCLNRVAPGCIRHLAHGAVVIGEYQRPSQARTRQLAELMQQAGIKCRVTENLEQAHWEKLVWNIPFNGLGVAGTAGYQAVISGEIDSHRPLLPCLTTDMLLGESRWEQVVRDLMLETIGIAQALRLDIPESAAHDQIERTRQMGSYKASTLIDFERGATLELDSLFLKPLEEANKAGVAAPRLAAMCQILQALDPNRKEART